MPLDELTGKAVELALGLTPDEEGDDVGKCSAIDMEYAENEAGFCLAAGATDDLVRQNGVSHCSMGTHRPMGPKLTLATWVESGTIGEGKQNARRSWTSSLA